MGEVLAPAWNRPDLERMTRASGLLLSRLPLIVFNPLQGLSGLIIVQTSPCLQKLLPNQSHRSTLPNLKDSLSSTEGPKFYSKKYSRW